MENKFSNITPLSSLGRGQAITASCWASSSDKDASDTEVSRLPLNSIVAFLRPLISFNFSILGSLCIVGPATSFGGHINK